MDGTDQRGHKCKTGTYCCFCGDYKTVPCKETLGRENLIDHFGGHGSHLRRSFRVSMVLRQPARHG